MRRRAVAIVIVSLLSLPLWAADEKVSLRSVANIARLALGCDPVVNDPEGADWVLSKPPDAFFIGGTPNQKMLVKAWHYGWALRTRSAELPTARANLLEFINRQQAQTNVAGTPFGHYATAAQANEELTSSHFQLWSAALAASYLYAIANGGTLNAQSANTTTLENGVRDATRRWWADEKNLYDRIHTNGLIDAPGARFGPNTALGPNPVRDDVYRLLKGDPPLKVRTCSADKYYTSSFVMQALRNVGIPALGVPLLGQTPDAKLYDKLCVYRSGSDWTLLFPAMRYVADPVFWVQKVGANKYYSKTTPGGKPPFAFPPGSLVDTIPNIVPASPQQQCPDPVLLNL